LLFQPEAGSQTSIPISESLFGLSVAATRQKAGKFWNAAFACAFPPGTLNPPAGTLCAIVMVVSGKDSEAMLSHVAATAGMAIVKTTANGYRCMLNSVHLA
jgi:hypothetical protein